ncbi:MAG: hypothetical protein MUF81_00085 [Verrucomicrobia bacterium]|jgi:hypothetical protein|nr:hypothetical protein [Verrucomicrobiota bacterium]
MKITSPLFEAFLKCPSKCHLRSLGETGSGNEYAEWVRAQDESYRREAARRLQEAVPETERVAAPPGIESFKTAKWRLAVNVVAQTPDRSADSLVRESQPDEETRGLGGPHHETRSSGRESAPSISHESQSRLASAATNLESRLHAIQRIPSEGRGRPAQFIPIRFIYRNKLTKDDKLLLAFDALMLSEILGREISFGKIIHGDPRSRARERADTLAANPSEQPIVPEASALSQARLQPQVLKVKTSALAGEVRKRLEKMTALLASR